MKKTRRIQRGPVFWMVVLGVLWAAQSCSLSNPFARTTESGEIDPTGDGTTAPVALVIPAPPQAGYWQASTDLLDLSFEVGQDGKSIRWVSIVLKGLTCSGARLNDTVTTMRDKPWKISGRDFAITNELALANKGNPPLLMVNITIQGAFDETGQQASGTWRADSNGRPCSSGDSTGPVSWNAFYSLEP